jgi:uncharacterized damage-inducible protein DinB
MSSVIQEPWLRGPLPGISPWLQPAGHAFVAALEDIEQALTGLTQDELWQDPGGAASIGYHLLHVNGSTDRLLTYARGEPLTDLQKETLRFERAPAKPLPTVESLLTAWRLTVDRALAQLGATSQDRLAEPRFVGRDRIPSTVGDLLFHAAVHAERHAGQIVATARIVRHANLPSG